ncbi:MAG: hypothetical protein JHD11_05610 [Ilumatobacteraceae bacterium]|jgi:hypothetical protein|nr:hypothetical protein [Ilumatobacteraceae bacterium]
MTMQNDEKNSDNLELIDKLKGISEQLADKALDALKQAHAAGESKRPEIERTLTQARRAVEKAISLLIRD